MTSKIKTMDDICIIDESPKNDKNEFITINIQQEILLKNIKKITKDINKLFDINIEDIDYITPFSLKNGTA